MPGHGQLFLTHHRQACWYSMHRFWKSVSSAMCLMFTSFLDIPFSPQMQLLFLSSGYLSFYFQILKTITSAWFSFAYPVTAPAIFLPSSMLRRFCISPSAFHLYRAMLPLEPAYPSQYTVHPVFFTGEVDKLSSQDSSV